MPSSETSTTQPLQQGTISNASVFSQSTPFGNGSKQEQCDCGQDDKVQRGTDRLILHRLPSCSSTLTRIIGAEQSSGQSLLYRAVAVLQRTPQHSILRNCHGSADPGIASLAEPLAVQAVLSLGSSLYTDSYTVHSNEPAMKKAAMQLAAYQEVIGGADETRTRDLRSDRKAKHTDTKVFRGCCCARKRP